MFDDSIRRDRIDNIYFLTSKFKCFIIDNKLRVLLIHSHVDLQCKTLTLSAQPGFRMILRIGRCKDYHKRLAKEQVKTGLGSCLKEHIQ